MSMTRRPMRLFAADSNIAMEEEFVDLMTGAHFQPAHVAARARCHEKAAEPTEGERGVQWAGGGYEGQHIRAAVTLPLQGSSA
jgi:hypothetical protein